MTYIKLPSQFISLLTLLMIIPGYSFAEEQKLTDPSEKTKIESKAALKSVLINPVPREMLIKYDEMRRRFSVPSMQNYVNPPVKRRKMHEITLLGSYMISMGNSMAERGASDLFLGRYSPWFGQGYKEFGWSGSNPPQSLDSVLGAAVVNQQNGFLTGFKFAINVHPRFQIELVYKGGKPGIQFDDDAWEVISSVLPDSVDTIREADRTVNYEDASHQSGDGTSLFGLNINFNILAKGPIIPYVSLGLVSVKNDDNPVIEYHLAQFREKEGEVTAGAATYFLAVNYIRNDTSAGPNLGLGTKIFLGKNFGIKIETKAVYAKLSVEQQVWTGFDSIGPWWLDYEDYYEVAAIQEINRFIIDGGIGLFFSW